MEPSSDHLRDTIFALSSGAAPSGVAVVRISGPAVRFGLETFIGSITEPRQAVLRSIRDRNDRLIDRGLVLFFPGPHSFTGEDCAEFHVHGGRAVITALLLALGKLPGFRLAEPGEFTRRAFEAGRLDLTEVEGLADLIAAQTEMQRRFALELAEGGLSTLYEDWSRRLLHARAMIEAELDFADEDDVPGSVAALIWQDMAALTDELRRHLDSAAIGERVRDGFQIVIAGPPNAGKSSLLNALARRDVAIVSAEAGTTRDIIEVHMDLGGYPVTLSDTAGLRETDSAVEQEGIRRAEAAMQRADLVLYLLDLDDAVPRPATGKNQLLIGTKADKIEAVRSDALDCTISSLTGEGLSELLALIQTRIECGFPAHALALPNRLRHRQHLTVCLVEIEAAVSGDEVPLELRAEHLRAAGAELDAIVGRTDVEQLLGVIFGEFCIGK